MTAPPPLPDPAHIETRLLIVTEMLDQAIAVVQHLMADIKTGPSQAPSSTDDGNADDHNSSTEQHANDAGGVADGPDHGVPGAA